MTGARRGRTLWRVAIVLALATASIALFRMTRPVINLDDASITLVYARHLASSGTLHYNDPGDPVDGFTSLLDVLLKAAALRMLSADGLRIASAAALLYHLAAVLLVLASLGVISSRDGPHRPWPATAAVLGAALAVALSPEIAQGSTTLLETPLFLLLVVSAALLTPCGPAERGHLVRWVLVTSLLPLARPEGLVLAAALALGALAAQWRTGGPPRRAWIASASVGVALLLHLGWRLVVFGHWAPNTYYAKSSAGRLFELVDGINYTIDHAHRSAAGLAQISLVLLAPALIALGRFATRAERTRYAVLSGTAVVALAATIFSGGDCYPGSSRFLVVPITLAVLGAAHAAVHLRGTAASVAAAILVFLAAAHLYGAVGTVRSGGSAPVPTPTDRAVACDADAARRLHELADGGSIAQSDYQRLKYFVDDARVIDLHGLNAREIAHRPRDGFVRYGKFSHADALEADAEIWVYGFRPPSRQPMAQFSMEQLLRDPELYRRYFGYGAAPRTDPTFGLVGDLVEDDPPTAGEIERMVARYAPASIPWCGDRHLNFLIRRDVAERVGGETALVGD